MAELVDEPLRTFRLLHDALAVVLADGAAEFVVVHGRPVLAFAPEPGHADAVFDLEDSARAIQPPDGRSVRFRLRQQLLEELPEVNVRSARSSSRHSCSHRPVFSVIFFLHFFNFRGEIFGTGVRMIGIWRRPAAMER